MENKIDKFFELLTDNNVSMVVEPIENQINYVKPDDDYDLHAYRILLLVLKCGIVKDMVSNHNLIYGREKFAFFDFLFRYPYYLCEVIKNSKKPELLEQMNLKPYEQLGVLTPMVTYIRGPWDFRYNQIFAYMVSKRLITILYQKTTNTGKKQFCIVLTSLGMKVAKEIEQIEPDWVKRMGVITSIFPNKTTNDKVKEYVQINFPELTLGGGVNVY